MTQSAHESLDATRLTQLFQALIKNAFDVIKVVDHDGHTLYTSQSVEKMLGRTPRELLGTNPIDYVHPDDQSRAIQIMQAIQRDGGSRRVDSIRVQHKDGSWRDLEVMIQDFTDDDAIRGVVLNYRDVTDRVRMQHQLEMFKERYEKAFRNSPDSITITYLDTGEFVEANEGFERISGFPRADIIGKTTLELKLWKSAEDRRRMTEGVKRDGHVRDLPVEIQVRNGSIRHCLVSAELIQLGGRDCLLGVTRDVTDARRADEILQRTTEALRLEHDELVQKNHALNQVLQHIEEDKDTFRHEVALNIDKLVRPYVNRLIEEGRLDRRDIDQLQRGLDAVTGRHIDQYKNNVSRLTPREMDILAMIRSGNSSKQIAETLGLSSQTVHKHRQSIRRKLQIDHRDVNLESYLRSH